MISAGTVEAYLRLSTEDFELGIFKALSLLGSLRVSSEDSASVFGVLTNSVAAVAQLMTHDLSGASMSAGQAISGLCTLSEKADTAFGNIQRTASAVASALGLSSIGAAAAVKTAAAGASTALASAADRARSSSGSVTSSLAGMATGAANSFSSAANSAELLGGAQTRSIAAAAGIRTGVTTQLGGLVGASRTIMMQVGAGMASGLSSKAGSIMAVASGIAGRVVATLRTALRISSPSRVTRSLGQYTGEGLALGIGDMQNDVARQAAALAQTAAQAMALPPDGAALAVPQITAPQYVGGKAAAEGAGALSGEAIESLTRRLDDIIDRMASTEQIMQVDGRSFGRLVREYV